MKKKKHLIKIITSIFLTLTLLLQFMLILPVSASDFSGTPGINLPYHYPTIEVNESIYWTTAREIVKIVDENSDLDLTWASNYFHNQVQDRISLIYGIRTEYPTCKYSKSYLDGKTFGRADLSQQYGGYTYIWEVKPVVYFINPTLRRNSFENQLDRYIDSDPTYRNGCKSGLNFGKETFTSKDTLFSITYEDLGNGMIVYAFDFLWDNIKKQVPSDVWFILIYPLLQKINSYFYEPSNNHEPGDAPGEDPEPGEEPSDDPEPGDTPDPTPSSGNAVVTAEDILAYETSNSILDAYNSISESILGTAKYEQFDTSDLLSITYYIAKNDLQKLRSRLDTLGKCAVAYILGRELISNIIGSTTSTKEYENASAAFLNILDDILSKDAGSVMVNGVCYLKLDANQAEAINKFKEYFASYESYDPDEYELMTKEMLEQLKQRSGEMSEDIKNQSSNYEESQNQYQRDPLIINFSGTDEIEFTSLADGINFDLDNNGFDERTAWIKNKDGFLAIDINGNGEIDNGGELFGDCFIMSNGKTSSNGFEALRSLDTNKNGKIDDNDALFGNVTVNQNETDEKYTLFDQLVVWYGDESRKDYVSLKSLNVDYIDLNCFPDPYNSENDTDNERSTRREETSYVYFKDGTARKHISEFWFDVNTINTVHDGEATVGNVKTIEQAIDDDETGELLNLCLSFNYSDDIAKKHYYLKKILYFITDSSDIAINSRGGNIDARDLHVIEAFMGHQFKGVNDDINPNAPAAEMLKEIYKNIENSYYNALNLKMSFGGYMAITFDGEDENGNEFLDTSLLNEVIDYKIDNNDNNAEILIYDLGVYLKSYDKIHHTNKFNEYKEYYSSRSQKYSEIIDLIGKSYTFIGTENDDKYNGSSSIDFIFDDEGNNKLCGSNANDRIYSGYGNDIMNGGSGDDSYYFGMFHADDIVNDTEGNNKIIFTDGLSVDDYTTSVSSNGKFMLINKYTGDTITLNDFIAHPFNYEFLSYDEVQTIGGGDAREVVEGTDGDDYLDASDGFNIFYGGNGNDTFAGGMNIDFMYGGNGDDTLLGRNGTNIMYGEAGNDTIYDGDDSSYLNGGADDDMLYGGGGADVLDGGTGNDYLQGDHGNDTYIYGIGYDVDTIAASSDLHTIVIHGYRISDMNNIREANNDLVIDFGKDTGDRMIVKAFFDFNANRDYSFVFDDGTVLGQYDIMAKTAPIVGTDDNDYLMGTNESDTINGGAGNDNLCGGNGEDTYIFGIGYAHDTINEWGSDHSYIDLTDINSDEITVSDQWGSNLLISVNDTDDVLTVSNFKWGQATFTLRFADGAEGYVDKNTWELVLTKQPEPVEEEVFEETNDNAEPELVSDTENFEETESDAVIEQDNNEKTDDTENNNESIPNSV